jgi:peptidylprolyl isomerase
MGKFILITLVIAALLVGGCGGGSSTEDTTASSKADTPAAKEDNSSAETETASSEKDETAAPTNPPPLWISGPQTPFRYQDELKIKPSGLAGSEPKPVIPNVQRPNRIAMKDLLDGIGTYFSTGEQVTVQYVGYDRSGKKFASSWDRGRPVTFTLGAGETIPAWEEALNGMEIADRRVVTVPPKLAEGNYPPNIPKGEPVVFILELLPRSSAKKAERPPRPKPAKQASKGAGGKKTKPKVVPPKGPKPKQLVVEDLEEGTGPEAQPGDELTVQYVGVGYESGTEFDTSWGKSPSPSRSATAN